jgi:hypothetical protein
LTLCAAGGGAAAGRLCRAARPPGGAKREPGVPGWMWMRCQGDRPSAPPSAARLDPIEPSSASNDGQDSQGRSTLSGINSRAGMHRLQPRDRLAEIAIHESRSRCRLLPPAESHRDTAQLHWIGVAKRLCQAQTANYRSPDRSNVGRFCHLSCRPTSSQVSVTVLSACHLNRHITLPFLDRRTRP